MSDPAKPAKRVPDWERIEVEYRAGVLSVRELAAEHGVSHTAIQKRAKGGKGRSAWDRDLSYKIHARADALVAKAQVASEVASATATNERQIVEANAAYIAQVRGEHRADIRKARNILASLTVELEGSVDTELLARIRALAAFEPADQESDYAAELLQVNRALATELAKLGTFGTRVAGAKTLTEALRNVIGLEREALGLDANSAGDKPAGRSFSDIERAARIASIFDRARRARDAGEEPPAAAGDEE